MSEETSALFAVPSFWEGAGRILDFGDFMTEYNQSVTPEEADEWAIARDWTAVGKDIRSAMHAVAEEVSAR